jgi:hypothetical protein
MSIRTVALISLAGLAALALPACHAQGPALHRVSRINVAAMSSGEQAERFSSLLQDELSKVGFEVVERTANSDAILSGSFTYEAGGDHVFARATVTLKSRDGKQTLWSGDYVSQHKGEGHEDVVKTVAENCAEQLRKTWQKSAP